MKRRYARMAGPAMALSVFANAAAAAPITVPPHLPARPPQAATLKFGSDFVDPRSILRAYAGYCETYRSDCDGLSGPRRPELIRLTPENWRRLVEIHARVYTGLRVRADLDKYAHGPAGEAPDVWTRAEDGEGDCEDFVLRWDYELRRAGFPRSALLKMLMDTPIVETMTLKEQDAATGETRTTTRTVHQKHLVLAIRTDRGVFIAESGNARLRPIQDLPRDWTIDRVESPGDGSRWVKAWVVPPSTTPTTLPPKSRQVTSATMRFRPPNP